ncbi:hypothetical protein L198_07967 [Cryptococcus wingfieldii CBS 7118]|uniref:Uncharacterized protein n=1 Tax=Cryptococcus wingfieldii CBS 7118 TaxID=1295528 RepID=A0A1E3HPA0_9TREE|nr:hypothetical protein L198_07967 [Cryptococcus wingfieldii CBS 7118]ODN78178.1 hypothetical protein L198_07967 [Cryptococcus wingfieldii CBS 7118]
MSSTLTISDSAQLDDILSNNAPLHGLQSVVINTPTYCASVPGNIDDLSNLIKQKTSRPVMVTIIANPPSQYQPSMLSAFLLSLLHAAPSGAIIIRIGYRQTEADNSWQHRTLTIHNFGDRDPAQVYLMEKWLEDLWAYDLSPVMSAHWWRWELKERYGGKETVFNSKVELHDEPWRIEVSAGSMVTRPYW